jgi:hypothetical protein
MSCFRILGSRIFTRLGRICFAFLTSIVSEGLTIFCIKIVSPFLGTKDGLSPYLLRCHWKIFTWKCILGAHCLLLKIDLLISLLERTLCIQSQITIQLLRSVTYSFCIYSCFLSLYCLFRGFLEVIFGLECYYLSVAILKIIESWIISLCWGPIASGSKLCDAHLCSAYWLWYQ